MRLPSNPVVALRPGGIARGVGVLVALAGLLGTGLAAAQAHEASGGPVESIASPAAPADKPAGVRRSAVSGATRSIELEPADAASPGAARAAARARAPGVPWQVGFAREIEPLRTVEAMADSLEWRTLPNGARVATLAVRSAGAPGLRLGVRVDRMPEDAQIRFFGGQDAEGVQFGGREILESIRRNTGVFERGSADDAARTIWSPYFESDAVTLELELPAGIDPAAVAIAVPRLSHFTERAFSGEAAKATTACGIDAACRSEWDSESRASAKLIYVDESGDSYLCSGTLLNNTARDFVPYFLTANHCISTQARASSAEFWWFYRAATCGSSSLDTRFTRTFGGAALLHATDRTDTSFLRLNQSAPAGTVFAGWLPSPVDSGGSVSGLHHPHGQIQEFATGLVSGYADCSALDINANFFCTPAGQASGEYLTVSTSSGNWEAGSSGSGLFTSVSGAHYLVGQLYGGGTGCFAVNRFGRFDLAFQSALARWLQPSTSTTLSVSKSGEGQVVSLPGGVDCGATCSGPYEAGTTVTLAASARPGHRFAGWGGACSGSAPLCSVTLSSSRSVTASFMPVASTGTGVLGTPVEGSTASGVGVISGYHCASKDLDVHIDGNWAGKAGAGTRLLGTQPVCGRTDTGYSILYNFNNLANGIHVVTVSAGGVQFDSHIFTTFQSGGIPWLTGASRQIVVSDFPRQGVTATLEWVQSYQNFLITWLDDGSGGSSPPPGFPVYRDLRVSVAGGSGSITVDGVGTCYSDCIASRQLGESLTLAASAARGFVFAGWSGACAGSGPLCKLSMDGDLDIAASFAPVAGAGVGHLGTPVDFSVVSGVGVISGYHCVSRDLEVFIDGVSAGKAGAGTRLLGTQDVCGRTDTGYSILYNFNNLADGLHVITVLADGVPLDSHTVWTVRSGGIPWLTGVSRTLTVPDFPTAGRTAILEWVQSYQNFLITGAQ